MAGFGTNDEVVQSQHPFGADDEVVFSSQPKQQLTNPPTFMDRISTELNGGGAALDPQKIVEGLGGNLGRTTQAWHDMFSGNANPSTLAEMVPVVGPMAVDASRKLFTPGQRIEGATDAGSLLAFPVMDNLPSEVPESLQRAGSVANGALKGGSKAAIAPVEYGMHKLPIPASLAGGAAGHFGGSMFGPVGSTIGTIAGAASPFVRGAIEGGRRAGELFDTMHAPYPGERPEFEPHVFTPPVFESEAPGNYAGVRLPSGRAIGPSPRVNEVNRPVAQVPERAPLWRDIPQAPQVERTEPVPLTGVSLPSGRVPGGATQGGVFAVPRANEIIEPVSPESDTAATYKTRASTSRSKFDSNGKRNQIK